MKRFIPALLLLTFIFSPKIYGPIRLGDIFVILSLPFYVINKKFNYRFYPEETAVLLFISWTSLITILSLLTDFNQQGFSALLTLLRYVEFCMIYFISYSSIISFQTSIKYIKYSALFSVLLLLLWAIFENLTGYFENQYLFVRAFNEGFFEGESNHIAGGIAVIGTVSLYTIIPSTIAIMLSGSRIAMFAFLAGSIRYLYFIKAKKILLLFAVVLVLMLSLMPHTWFMRFQDSLSLYGTYKGPNVDRFESWRLIISETPLLFGTGPGSRPNSVYESFFVMVFAETGIIGLLIFVSSLFLFFIRQRNNSIPAAVIIILSVLSITSNAFIIARILGPAAVILGAFREQS